MQIFLKKIALILIFSMFLFTSCVNESPKSALKKAFEGKDKIIVGISFDSKPFGYKDKDGLIKGLEADLAKEIGERLFEDGKEIEFKDVTSQDRLKSVLSGEVDMIISTMTITRERKKLLYFSSPYFVAGQAICVRKDSKIDSIYDLINKRVIVILGTTGEKNIKKFVPSAFIQGYVNNSDAIDAFKTGQNDAITTDDSLLQGLIIENTQYVLLPERLTKEPYGIAFKKSKQGRALKKAVDDAIKDLKNDGSLERLKNQWMGE